MNWGIANRFPAMKAFCRPFIMRTSERARSSSSSHFREMAHSKIRSYPHLFNCLDTRQSSGYSCVQTVRVGSSIEQLIHVKPPCTSVAEIKGRDKLACKHGPELTRDSTTSLRGANLGSFQAYHLQCSSKEFTTVQRQASMKVSHGRYAEGKKESILLKP